MLWFRVFRNYVFEHVLILNCPAWTAPKLNCCTSPFVPFSGHPTRYHLVSNSYTYSFINGISQMQKRIRLVYFVWSMFIELFTPHPQLVLLNCVPFCTFEVTLFSMFWATLQKNQVVIFIQMSFWTILIHISNPPSKSLTLSYVCFAVKEDTVSWRSNPNKANFVFQSTESLY